MPKILMIEDSPPNADLYCAYLEKAGIESALAVTGADGLELATSQRFDLLLLDLELPDGNGLNVLRALKAKGCLLPTVVLTGNGSVQAAVDAMQEGAMDFLMKPCSAAKLSESIRSALDRWQAKGVAGSAGSKGPSGFFGESSAMRNVFTLIERAAASEASVFITGESGTGKELCAQAVHNFSDRRNGPFIAINCAALPRDLMESEIFGHRRGAFTGALEDRTGAAEAANGGTLFLDEICEMDIELQAKLLRFIQTSSYRRVGDAKEISADIRFICATNQDPLASVGNGQFREDLYYRLHVIPIEMPPLRERGPDIVMLAERFLRDFSEIEGKNFSVFDAAAMDRLRSNPWKGNVRELENVIRNIVVMNDGDTVAAEMFPFADKKMPSEETPSSQIATEDLLVRPLVELEIMAIDAALARFDGNVSKAARALDISPSTIYRKKDAWQKRGST